MSAIEARRRYFRGRAFFRSQGRCLAFVLSGFAVTSVAVEEDCLKLPERERPFCWMMLSCAAIEDERRRTECFDAVVARYRGQGAVKDGVPGPLAAQRDREEAPASKRQVVPTAAAPVEAREPIPVGEAKLERRAPVVQAKPQVQGEPAPPSEHDQAPPTQFSQIEEATVERQVLAIPKRFEGQVTHVEKLLHDRQLLVVDGRLLFEATRASLGRIRPGDAVRVVRTSALLGERYSISGPRGSAVRASRLRCEAENAGTDTRRKCTVLARFRQAEAS